jgi:hypothetical protein
MSVKIVDNVFTEQEIADIHEECLKIPYTWSTPRKHDWRFWSSFVVTDQFPAKNELNRYHNINKLWEGVKTALSFEENEYRIHTIYLNAQSVGNESPMHTDSGDLSIIYYTNPNWKLEWDGGTTFYNQERTDSIGSAAYKPGRFVAYDSKIPHRPNAISMYSNELRVVVVFKLFKV